MRRCPACDETYGDDVAKCPKDGIDLATEEDPEHLKSGQQVGEYRIESLLGEGGFGAVYRAIHPLIGKPAAVKVLKREFSAKGEMAARFIAEARAVNQIRHRNIIDVFSFGQLPDGRHYYVMELLEGTTLEAYFQGRGRLPPGEAIAILRPLARALGAAHARGIAHRDLKPENVFLAFDDEGRPIPKLLDFGIAKLMGEDAMKQKTQSGVPIGTPAYMSPEQVHGKNVDHRTDIYAFGIVAFEVMTGALPFEGHSMLDIMVQQATKPAPPMSSRVPELAPLDNPIIAMMAKEPANRPQNILDAMDALTEAAVSAGIVEATQFPRLAHAAGEGARTPHFSGSSWSGAGVASRPVPSGVPSSNNAVSAVAATALHEKSPTFSGTERESLSQPPKRRTGLYLGVGLGVLVLVGGGVGAGLALQKKGADTSSNAASTNPPPVASSASSQETPTQATPVVVAPASAQVSASASAPASTPAEIKITLKIKAANAEVVFGSATHKVQNGEDIVSIPASTSAVEITVKAPGYYPKKVSVVPDKDASVDVALVPQKKEYQW